MYEKRSFLEKKKRGLNQEYLGLLKETIEYVKEVNNTDILYSTIRTVVYQLGTIFGYLELALSIKKRYEKLELLLCIFTKLSTKEKVLVRKEVYKELTLIRSKSKKEKLFHLIFDTEDKELVLFYKQEIENLKPKYLSTKLGFLISLSKFASSEEGYQLQSKALEYALEADNGTTYYDLFRLLHRELHPSIKERALNFVLDNWSKLDWELDTRLHYASIIAEHCPTQAKPIIDELYQQAKRLNRTKKNKTEAINTLIALAGEPHCKDFAFFSQEAVYVVEGMKEEDRVETSVLFSLSDIASGGLLVELYDLIAERFAPNRKPEVIVELLINILEKLPKEQGKEKLGQLSFYITQLGLKGDMGAYLWKSLKLLPYFPEEARQESASTLLELVSNNQSERDQARAFSYLAQYLSQEDRVVLLSLIDEMESTTHKAAALANVINCFEGNEFISLARKLLELIKISFENDQEHLVCSLIAAIGKKLCNLEGEVCN